MRTRFEGGYKTNLLIFFLCQMRQLFCQFPRSCHLLVLGKYIMLSIKVLTPGLLRWASFVQDWHWFPVNLDKGASQEVLTWKGVSFKEAIFKITTPWNLGFFGLRWPLCCLSDFAENKPCPSRFCDASNATQIPMLEWLQIAIWTQAIPELRWLAKTIKSASKKFWVIFKIFEFLRPKQLLSMILFVYFRKD